MEIKNFLLRTGATLIFLFSFSLTAANSEREIGYISYQTTNIGDDIQAIAVRNFLPKNCVPIDRELISEFKHHSVLPTVVSGWFMHEKKNIILHTSHDHTPEKIWPPSPSIHPFFTSIHLTGGLRKALTPGRARLL